MTDPPAGSQIARRLVSRACSILDPIRQLFPAARLLRHAWPLGRFPAPASQWSALAGDLRYTSSSGPRQVFRGPHELVESGPRGGGQSAISEQDCVLREVRSARGWTVLPPTIHLYTPSGRVPASLARAQPAFGLSAARSRAYLPGLASLGLDTGSSLPYRKHNRDRRTCLLPLSSSYRDNAPSLCLVSEGQGDRCRSALTTLKGREVGH